MRRHGYQIFGRLVAVAFYGAAGLNLQPSLTRQWLETAYGGVCTCWSSKQQSDITCVYVAYFVMLVALYPRTSSPHFIGPLNTNVTYLGAGPFTDFYFICRLRHSVSSDTRKPGFVVFLTFDSQLSSHLSKTTTESSPDVVFTSHDVKPGFGTKVSVCRFIGITAHRLDGSCKLWS